MIGTLKRIFFQSALFLLVVACNKKSVPVITERKMEPFKPASSNASIVAPDTLAGRTIFINKCGKCHGLPDPIQFTPKRWEVILYSMIPKARLNDEQAVHVTAYVRAN